MKIKKYLWIVPIAIILIMLGIFSTTKYSVSYCGDGVCERKEIDTCQSDCKQSCTIATGALEQSDNQIKETCSEGWQASYTLGLDNGYVKIDWLKPNNEIDFGNAKIQELAKELKRDNVKDTARAIAEWTYNNIEYDSSDGYFDCRGKTASQILDRGSGVCSTMSKLNIALLRANGIAAYSITGCFKYNEACKLQQTFFTGRLPKLFNISVDAEGYAPTLGYLHNWVIVPFIEDGTWKEAILESTSGNLYTSSCIDYRKYYVAPPDSIACGLTSLDPNLRDCQQW